MQPIVVTNPSRFQVFGRFSLNGTLSIRDITDPFNYLSSNPGDAQKKSKLYQFTLNIKFEC